LVDRICRNSGAGPAPDPSLRTSGPRENESRFDSILRQATGQTEALRISCHAKKRLDASAVTLTDSDLVRIDGAVEKAARKGAGQSVVVLDDLALVISVRNRVVITAVHGDRMREGVFTNIDSVVIA